MDVRQPGVFTDKAVHWWLIRHGETENNVLEDSLAAKPDLSAVERRKQFKSGRSADPRLSVRGMEQVQELLKHPALQRLFEPVRPVKLFCSPLHRTIETAAPLLSQFPRATLKPIPMLHEGGGLYHTVDGVDVGLAGRTPTEFREAFPSISDRLDLSECPEQGWYGTHLGKEDESMGGAFSQRIEKVAAWMHSQVPDSESGAKDFVLVGHGALFDKLVCELLGSGHSVVIHVNTGVSHLELCNKAVRVHCINSPPAAPTSTSIAATSGVSV